MLKKSEYKYRSKCLRGKARQKQRYDPNICPECGGRLRLIQGPLVNLWDARIILRVNLIEE